MTTTPINETEKSTTHFQFLFVVVVAFVFVIVAGLLVAVDGKYVTSASNSSESDK